MKPTPILFLSDSPSLPTGLARITKDLAMLTAQLPEFRVGVLGRGGHGSAQLPFAQYNFGEFDQWGETHIEDVWSDFARGDQGVIFTIWDASRLGWFAQPMMGGSLEKFLKSGKFKRWGYFPVDSYGIGGKLTAQCADTLREYDRVLAYTLFGKQVLEATVVGPYVDWIPHGFNGKVFTPKGQTPGRLMLNVSDKDKLVGCVMTNQARKDWGVAFGAIAYLKNQVKNLKFWAHVDVLDRSWNLLALAQDFGLTDTVTITINGDYSSEQMSYLYSACDVTMLPSLGEGFGFPIVESLACGVPVVHGDYGGGAELVPDANWLVKPVCERLEGPWNCIRPVWSPIDWANKLAAVLKAVDEGETDGIACVNSVEHLRWGNLWPSAWMKWMLEGLRK